MTVSPLHVRAHNVMLWGCLLAVGLATHGAQAAPVADLVAQAAQLFKPANLAAYYLECLGVAAVLIYVANILLGRRDNHVLAQAWSNVYTAPDGVLARNFGTYGQVDAVAKELAWKEDAATYCIYASERRNCKGALCTIKLKGRQDLVSCVWDVFSPAEDQVQVEVLLSDTVAQPVVLAVATQRAIRSLAKEHGDVAAYCKALSVAKDRMPSWPSTLAVMAEQSSIFYDVFAEPRVLGVLAGKDGASAAAMAHFRSLRYSNECTGLYASKIVLTAALPPPERMEEVQPLLALVFALADLMAAYSMPADVRKRATELRAKVAADAQKQDEDAKEARQKALQEKQEKKQKEETDRLALMSPEARAKYKERQARVQQKRQLRVRQKMVRV